MHAVLLLVVAITSVASCCLFQLETSEDNCASDEDGCCSVPCSTGLDMLSSVTGHVFLEAVEPCRHLPNDELGQGLLVPVSIFQPPKA